MARTRVTNGPAIRERRERLGILQADLAEQIGVSGSYLSRIESGAETPGMGTMTVHDLAEALKVSLDDITVPASELAS
ncbi:MAG: Helix-turn-helix domain [Streptosporangiaceae bacterium]|nr:Helix-turn-helix domain [Streptosporangiaceae bacterium]